MKKRYFANPHLEWLDAEAFLDDFPSGAATLMSPDCLRTELVLLRKACAPAPDETVPSPSEESTFEDRRNQAFQLLIDTKVLASPADVADVRHALRYVLPTERFVLHELVEHALSHLRACRNTAPLFLVSPYWYVRMADTVSGDLYAARVKHWDLKDPRPRHFPE